MLVSLHLFFLLFRRCVTIFGKRRFKTVLTFLGEIQCLSNFFCTLTQMLQVDLLPYSKTTLNISFNYIRFIKDTIQLDMMYLTACKSYFSFHRNYRQTIVKTETVTTS